MGWNKKSACSGRDLRGQQKETQGYFQTGGRHDSFYGRESVDMCWKEKSVKRFMGVLWEVVWALLDGGGLQLGEQIIVKITS